MDVSKQTPIIYFDNAATSYPKPENVYRTADEYFRSLTSAGRGAHALALKTGRKVYESRESIADFLGAKKSERLVFTSGCTHSLNMVLKSFLAERLAKLAPIRRIVLLSSLEHNSVMRPLHQIDAQVGLSCEFLPYKPGHFCQPDDLRDHLRRINPALFILTEGSNVTGEIADIEAIADICKEQNVPLLVDAAQTAGRFPGCLAHDGISFWCASAHKGLMSSAGLGLLYVNPDFDLPPLIAGGTGSASEQMEMPSAYPDHLESGTAPAFLIATLAAAIDWLKETTVEKIRLHEDALAEHFLSWCHQRDRVEVFGFTPEEPDAQQEIEMPAAYAKKDLEMRRETDYRRERRAEFVAAGFERKRESDFRRDRRTGSYDRRAETEQVSSAADVQIQGSNQVTSDAGSDAGRLPLISFRIEGISADVVADHLDRSANVAVRAGLHCAAQAHRTLGTLETGLVRASFGYFNSLEEVEICCQKLDELMTGDWS